MKITGYNLLNRDVLILQSESLVSGLHVVYEEIRRLGNPLGIVRFDVYDYIGFVCRINVDVLDALHIILNPENN